MRIERLTIVPAQSQKEDGENWSADRGDSRAIQGQAGPRNLSNLSGREGGPVRHMITFRVFTTVLGVDGFFYFSHSLGLE